MKNNLHLVVPLILISVFIHQIYLVQTDDLTQWKGGGFGMFSTIDKPSDRIVSIYLNTDEDKVAIELPFNDELNSQLVRTIALPNKNNAYELISFINKTNWKCYAYNTPETSEMMECIYAVPVEKVNTEDSINYRSVTINISRINYTQAEEKVYRNNISTFTFDKPNKHE